MPLGFDPPVAPVMIPAAWIATQMAISTNAMSNFHNITSAVTPRHERVMHERSSLQQLDDAQELAIGTIFLEPWRPLRKCGRLGT